MANLLFKGPCNKCTSSDAMATYDDGSTHCYSCKANGRVDGSSQPQRGGKKRASIRWRFDAIVPRGITEATCKRCDYGQGELADGTPVHIQLIKDDKGRVIDQKTRDPEKNFRWLGDSKFTGIIGSWSWPEKGKSVVITEGEIDRMSVSQAFDNKWATGSLPNGSGSVKKAILADFEKLLRFDSIVLCFDNDKPGQEALKEACELLPVGRVKIMTLPKKDANAVLMDATMGPSVLVRAFWDAKPYRPDGIREGREFTKELLKKKRRVGYALPYPLINEKLMGLRKGEITMLTAGSGIGKSTLARHIAYHLRMEHGLKIGNIYLEEDNETTVDAYIGLHAGVPLKRILSDPECLTDDQWDAALEAVIYDRMMFYDHFGSLANERLLTMMRYMAASGCDFIVLDHVSIVTSGLESSSEGERKDIDILMTKLRAFVQETGVGIIAIVHLKRKPGVSFNEGGQVSLNDFRGSASLEQLSDNAVAMERNQQDEAKKDTAKTRVLKCRVTGDTGEADSLRWDKDKGRYELASPFEAQQEFDPHATGEDKEF